METNPPDDARAVQVREYYRLRFGKWETVRSHTRRPPKRKPPGLKKAA